MQYFEFSPSLYLGFLLVAAHGAALAVLPFLTLPVWARLALAILLIWSLLYYLQRDVRLRLKTSCIGLAPEQDEIIMFMRDGTHLASEILHGSLVTPCFTVLNVRPNGARFARSVVILPDSLNPESFRQLRVWLKWSSQAER